MTKFLQWIGILVFIVGCGIVNALVKLWCIVKLWTWFLVPIGLPLIPRANIYGALLIISILRGFTRNKDDREPSEKITDSFKDTLFYMVCSMLAVLIGYVVKSIFL